MHILEHGGMIVLFLFVNLHNLLNLSHNIDFSQLNFLFTLRLAREPKIECYGFGLVIYCKVGGGQAWLNFKRGD